MSERERRLALNESMFRQVNERLEELNQTFAEFTGEVDLVCECPDVECAERLRLLPEVYDRVRDDPTLFIVVPGHVVKDVEETTAEAIGYRIVRKREGESAQIARAITHETPEGRLAITSSLPRRETPDYLISSSSRRRRTQRASRSVSKPAVVGSFLTRRLSAAVVAA